MLLFSGRENVLRVFIFMRVVPPFPNNALGLEWVSVLVGLAVETRKQDMLAVFFSAVSKEGWENVPPH
jgi:hypothetical protein